MVLHADLRRVLDLRRRAADDRTQAGRGHRACRSDFALATDLCAGYRRIAFDEISHGRRREQEGAYARLIGVGQEMPVVHERGRQDARRAVRRGGDDAPSPAFCSLTASANRSIHAASDDSRCRRLPEACWLNTSPFDRNLA